MSTLRYGVLTIAGLRHPGYVVFDRATGQIVDGVYVRKQDALEVAACNNIRHAAPKDMTPTACALGLEFPSDDLLAALMAPEAPDAEEAV
jgi:hypothetical protein